MTEAEWLVAAEPQRMLDFLRGTGRATGRKLRLFACACCRRVWHMIPDRGAVEVAECFADGLVKAGKLRRARTAALAALQDRGDEWVTNAGCQATSQRSWEAACWTSASVAEAVGLSACPPGSLVTPHSGPAEYVAAVEAELRKHARLLRDVIGNPFRPASLDPACSTPDVLRLAQAAYGNRQLPSGHLDPARLAVLADALEDAGYDDAQLLAHLRGEGPHRRGCWAVDAVLGKS